MAAKFRCQTTCRQVIIPAVWLEGVLVNQLYSWVEDLGCQLEVAEGLHSQEEASRRQGVLHPKVVAWLQGSEKNGEEKE